MNLINSCLLLTIGGSNIKTYTGAQAATKLNDILIGVGMGVGGILVAVAVMKLIMAMGEESATSKANASVMLGSGIFFLSLSTVLKVIGLSSDMAINSGTPRLIAGNTVTVLGQMMTYAGGAMVILGIFQNVLAIAQEQSEAVQKASTVLGIGIGMLSSGWVTGKLAIKIKAGTLKEDYAVNTVIDFIAGLATYIGGGMVMMAVLKLVNSLRQEDTPERNKAILLLGTGIALLSFRVIVQLIKG